jgi:Uma2 family endonuclease
MPAVAERKLSVEEFHRRFGDEKPYFEFWDGEAVQKSMPTRLHALIQKILVKWLDALGYEAGQEITLKLDPAYEPIPDVIAAEGSIGDPYPTEPFEIAIEILSPDDSFSRTLRKCGLYRSWGIQQVIGVDPSAREIWLFENGSLQKTDVVARRHDRIITARELWAEIDRVLATTLHEQAQ